MQETHRQSNRTWAVVLAGGSGNRLRDLTTDARGVSVPKQYCSLTGGPSLLELAMRRAERVVPRDNVTVIVAAQHRQWWTPALACVTPDNVVVQPTNRGTGLGILLTVLNIVRRDPDARIVFLPSDHFVDDELALARAARTALEQLHADDDILMLGITPESADPELGYIVPADHADGVALRVARFVEKPPRSVAEHLLASRCYWNSFIFAASARLLVSQFEAYCPMELAQMRNALCADTYEARADRLAQLYQRLPEIDFSRHIVERSPDRLKVLPVVACGWNDLGTPQRLVETLRRLDAAKPPARHRAVAPPVWNLAQAHASLAAAV